MVRLVILSLVLLFASVGWPLAAAKVTQKRNAASEASTKSSTGFEFNKKDPIYITADWMEVDQKQSTITYKGQVVTTQKDMTMRSEVLKAYYDPQMKEIKRIIAEGKVNATQGNRVATGEKAVFDNQTKTVTLTGSPVMRQGNSQVSGVKVIYYMEEDKAVAEGNNKVRVQATIFPEELKGRERGDDKKK